MSRSAYGQRECDYCGRWISTAGWAWTSHMRKHVREGLVTEKRAIDYSQGERNFRTYLRFSATEEGKRARKSLVKKVRSQKGQGLIEYAMLIVLVAVIVIVLLGIFGRSVGNMFSNIISNI